MKYKILHLTSSLKVGGAETLLVDLLRSIDKNEFENYVIYFHSGPNIERIESLGIKTFQIKGLFCKYDPIFFIRLFLLIKKLRPDCIHSLLWAANFSGTLIAFLLRIPIVCALHLASNFESKNKNNLIRAILDKFTFTFANKLVAVSDTVLNELNNSFKISAEKIEVIKNGIDVNYIKLKASEVKKTKSDFNLNNDHFIIGSVGRFIPRKRHDFLIDCFALLAKKYSNMRLMLIGSGELENYLRIKTIELKIQEKVMFIYSSEAYSFYPFFDVFALTSEQEGLSIALLEAMSFGVPSVITSPNALHEVIETDKNGMVVEIDNKDEFNSAIEKIYLDKDFAHHLSVNATKTALMNYNLHNMTDAYCKIFKDNITKINY